MLVFVFIFFFLCIHTLSFGALERRYLSAELRPLLEALGVVPEVPVDGLAAMAMAFTRRMEEVGRCWSSRQGPGLEALVLSVLENTFGGKGRG